MDRKIDMSRKNVKHGMMKKPEDLQRACITCFKVTLNQKNI